MPDDSISLSEAWTLLGRDPSRIMNTIAKLPRDQRVAAAEKIFEKAKRMAAVASAPHHPDVGGDPNKFKRIWDALGVIEKHTNDFKVKMKEFEDRAERRTKKGPFIRIDK